MLKNVLKILRLLSPDERRQVYMLLPAMVVMGLVQVVGIASILPFLSLATDPSAIKSNSLLHWLYTLLKFTDTNRFLIFLGIAVLFFMTFSNAFSAFTTWMLYRFSFMRNHSLAMQLLKKYLYQPYTYFLNHNSATLSTNMLSEVQQFVVGVLVPGMQMVESIITTGFILVLLVISEPTLAILTALLLGGTYVGVYGLVRRSLGSTGKERVKANKQRYKIASEALGGIKEIKLMGKEEAFIDQFSIPSEKYASTQATSTILGQLPRYAIETIAFGGLLLIVLFLLASGRNMTQLLPVLGLYALAAYRLLPALQIIFSTFTRIKFYQAALDALYVDLEGNQGQDQQKMIKRESIPVLPFKNALELLDINFSYPETEAPIFEKLNLIIKPNTSVAFVGPTGAGKTTLVDIILGLLQPQGGQILVDGSPINDKNLPNWQKNLGYVPQNIFLADDTLAHNIAFGSSHHQVDMDAVVRAAKIASLHDFIMDLPEKYDTLVGERGVRLSGGQRQRVGIARALYHDPDIIIFDEATNALDGITEENVFSAIADISKLKTVIIIAHRLSTIRECDAIFMLEKGCIVAQDTYSVLLNSNAQFRAMAKEGVAEAG